LWFAWGAGAAPAAVAGRIVRIDGPRDAVLSEPDLAVDPARPGRVLVVSKDFAGAYRTLDAYRSSDGGAHFSGGPVVSGAYLGAPADASDPTIAFDRAGHAFFGQLVWRYPARGFDALMGVQQSDDGGASFGAPVAAISAHNASANPRFGQHPAPSTTYDKEWLAVDNTGRAGDGTLYMTWLRFHISRSDVAQSSVMVAARPAGAAAFETPVTVSAPDRYAVGPRIVVAPNGSVLVAWTDFRRSRHERVAAVAVARSTDGGRTFSAPRPVRSFVPARSPGFASGPDANQLVALAGAGDGRLLMCWNQGGRGETACVPSSDGGRRWSSPVVAGSRVGGVHELVQVAGDGARGFDATFYAEGARSTVVALVRSADGGASFGAPVVLARRSYALSSFVGDYTGLAAGGGRVYAAFVLPRGGAGSSNSIYVASVR
jgi:hypothetical protein